ncbi:MAG: OadG family protein [Anaerolineaceae bacterium]
MTEAINQGLTITGLGMGLVFAMILALWGIMALLVRLTNRKPEEDKKLEDADTPSEQASGEVSLNMQKQAAAVAVVYALALAHSGKTQSASAKPSTGSQWLSSGRLQQTLRNSNRGRK